VIDVSFQLYIMDNWFGNYFSSNGQNMIAISRMPTDERTDPIIETFPRVNQIVIFFAFCLDVAILLQNIKFRNLKFTESGQIY
jgi:hypothetical protein